MSYAEVCEEVKSWDLERREQLARHLKMLQVANDLARMAELTCGIEEIQAGGGISREELRTRNHDRVLCGKDSYAL